MKFIAHIRHTDGQIQLLRDHLLQVRSIAEYYGSKFGAKYLAGLAGILHDVGKYSVDFQQYIQAAYDNPESPPRRGSVDHSSAGGIYLFNKFHTEKSSRDEMILSEVVGNAIISHHTYLRDFLSPDLSSKFLVRVKENVEINNQLSSIFNLFFEEVLSENEFRDYISNALEEIHQFLINNQGDKASSKLMYWSKLIFSVLIDADRTDSRLFDEKKSFIPNNNSKQLFKNYYERLMVDLHRKSIQAKTTKINRFRRELSDRCYEYANKPTGIYTLSMPTGSGKTLASLRYALHHAIQTGKERIIYVLPFTTIIEQNALEIKQILNDKVHILEHHSNITHPVTGSWLEKDNMVSQEESEEALPNNNVFLENALLNWDAPIIFTSMVQYLDTFYSKGNRNIRRLHQLCNSILIFDEIQKVPLHCISLFNEATNFLNRYCNTGAILCTATQPSLDYVPRKIAISSDAEMIEDLESVYQAFKRVNIVDLASDREYSTLDVAELINAQLEEKSSVLVILNTKSAVKKLYQLLTETILDSKNDVFVFHLSTSMCAAHRKVALRKIRRLLKQKGKKVVCISTPLIEAGVDISFSCVIRSVAGLDSIAQAAGRCNRHGELPIQNVYLINQGEEHLNHLPEIKKGKEITLHMLRDLRLNYQEFEGDILSTKAMEIYFKKYYDSIRHELDYPIDKYNTTMVDLLMQPLEKSNTLAFAYCQNKGVKAFPLLLANSYQTAADCFEVIDKGTTTVIVPCGKGKRIITELLSNCSSETYSYLLKQAQLYSVQIYNHELVLLDKNKGISYEERSQTYILKEGFYNAQFGIDLEGRSDLTNIMF